MDSAKYYVTQLSARFSLTTLLVSRPAVFVSVVAAGFFTLVYVIHQPGYWSPDQYTFGLVANGLYKYHASVNTFTHFENLPYSHYSNRPPLYSLLIASVFLVIGPGAEIASFVVNGVAYAVLVGLVYLLGRDLYSAHVGVFAAVLTATSPFVFEYAMSGLSDLLFATLLVATFYAVMRELPAPYVGVLSGLAALTRGNMLVAVPIIALFLWERAEYEWRPFVGYSVAFCCTMLPWWVRNLLVAGTPFASDQIYHVAAFTPIYPGQTAYRQRIDPVGFILEYPGVLAAKFRGNIVMFITGFPDLLVISGTGLLFLFLLIGVGITLVRWRDADWVLSFWYLVIAVFATQLLAFAIIHYEHRYLLALAPFLYILAALGGIELVTSIADLIPQVAVVGVACLLLVAPAAGAALVSPPSTGYPYAEMRDEAEHVDRLVPDEILVLTTSRVAGFNHPNQRWAKLPREKATFQRGVWPRTHYVFLSAMYDTSWGLSHDFNESAFDANYTTVKRFETDGVLLKPED